MARDAKEVYLTFGSMDKGYMGYLKLGLQGNDPLMRMQTYAALACEQFNGCEALNHDCYSNCPCS